MFIRAGINFIGILIVIGLNLTFASAQKYDNNWLVGYRYSLQDTFNNNLLNFSQGTISVYKKYSLCNFDLSFDLSFSDIEGNFLFYTNGCKIYDANNNLIKNGDDINSGSIADIFCGNGYPSSQAGIVLPSPGKTNEFEFISFLTESTKHYGAQSVNFLNSHLIFKDGEGEVKTKNVSILQDTFSLSNLMACKHSNGNDWWILLPKVNSNGYFRVLLNSDGFTVKGLQSIGPAFNYLTDWCGQSVFNQDGTKYARFDRGNDLTIFDFDRCDGLLYNPIHIDIHDLADTFSMGCGLAFSPNGRFLYATSGYKIYQFDMEAKVIALSQQIVSDGYKDSLPSNFYLAQLAPDNKIYICSANAEYSLHVIDQPDLPGKACNVKKRGLKLSSPVIGALPFYPNYKLGYSAINCSDTAHNEFSILIFPNPTWNTLSVSTVGLEFTNLSIILYDVLGRKVLEKDLIENVQSFDISMLPASIYFYNITNHSNIFQNGKLIKL